MIKQIQKDGKKEAWKYFKETKGWFKEFKNYDDWLKRNEKQDKKLPKKTTEQLKVDYKIKVEPKKKMKRVEIKIKTPDGEITCSDYKEEELSKDDEKAIAELSKIKDIEQGRQTIIKN